MVQEAAAVPLAPQENLPAPRPHHAHSSHHPNRAHPLLLLLLLLLEVQPFMYKSWDEPYSAGQEVHPMFWDAECPDYVPPSMQHLADAARESANKPHGGWEDAEAGEEL
jgi:hypothetical protein